MPWEADGFLSEAADGFLSEAAHVRSCSMVIKKILLLKAPCNDLIHVFTYPGFYPGFHEAGTYT
jgi:hypothetical protein